MTSPFIPLYRQFPVTDEHNLEKQLVNSYQQVATAVNQRDIGTYDTNIIPNGQRWFSAPNQQRLRDGQRIVVQVSDALLTVPHGITLINQATRLYGAFQDAGGNWWPLPYVDIVAATNQINVHVDATNIVVQKGGGAPSINLGVVVFEFL